MMTDLQHELVLDSTLDLIGRTSTSTEYQLVAKSADSTFGNPQPIEAGIVSLIMDGHLVRKVADDNREAYFRITVKAETSLGLAMGERALNLACGKRTTLVWTPPDGWGAPATFDVLYATLELIPGGDRLEVLLTERTYGLRLRLLPFSRSGVTLSQAFGPATPTYTTLDNGSSTSNFASYAATFSTTTHGSPPQIAVKIVPTPGNSDNVTRVQWLGDPGATPFVALEIDGFPPAFGPFYYGPVLPSPYGSGFYTFPLASIQTSDGFTRYFFNRSDFSSGIGHGEFILLGAPPTGVYVGGIYSATSVPSVNLFGLSVVGSARAPGTIRATGAHGKGLILYTDSTMMSQGWLPNSSSTWGRCPEGTYIAVFRVTTQGHLPGATITFTNGTVRRLQLANGDPYGYAGQFIDAGRLYVAAKEDGTAVAITGLGFSAVDEDGDPVSDFAGEWSIYRIDDDTALTVLSGTSSTDLGSSVAVVAPSELHPRGGVYQSGAPIVGEQIRSYKPINFQVPFTGVFALAGSGNKPTLTAEYDPHWHTNPLPLDNAA